MLKTLLAAVLCIGLTGAAYAQSSSKPAKSAKKQACQTEMKAKNVTDKVQRKAFMKECESRT